MASVPCRGEASKSRGSEGHQETGSRDTVPLETSRNRIVVRMEELQGSGQTLSTEVRSILRNHLSKRCVSCVPSAVALRKRSPELRTVALRTVDFAYPSASPKSTLCGVFERMKRAARTKKFERMAERLAPPSKRPAYAFQPARWPASKSPSDGARPTLNEPDKQ